MIYISLIKPKEMETTVGKIKNGTIKIENGKIIGLGEFNESLSIEALDNLIGYMGNNGVIETLSNIMSGIAQVQGALVELRHDDDKELRELFDGWISPAMPTRIDIHNLNMILKTFNK